MASVQRPVSVPRQGIPGSPAGAGHSFKKPSGPKRDNRAGYLFLTPWLLGLVLLTAGPMLASLYLAFTQYDLFSAPKWIGLGNFRRMLTDQQLHSSAVVTAIYVLVGTPIKLASALAVAVLLNARMRGMSFYRSAFYAPSLIGSSVSIAIAWRLLFSEEGFVDQMLSAVGIELGGWAGNPELAMPMLMALAAWQFGAPMVIFLAGLKGVPPELLEAAALDGAGRIRRFFSVTMPMISPVLFFNLLLETINAFQAFTAAYIVGGAGGAPGGSTLFYTVYLYARAFVDRQMGYASALAWLLMVVVGIIAGIYFHSSRRWVHYASEAQ